LKEDLDKCTGVMEYISTSSLLLNIMNIFQREVTALHHNFFTRNLSSKRLRYIHSNLSSILHFAFAPTFKAMTINETFLNLLRDF